MSQFSYKVKTDFCISKHHIIIQVSSKPRRRGQRALSFFSLSFANMVIFPGRHSLIYYWLDIGHMVTTKPLSGEKNWNHYDCFNYLSHGSGAAFLYEEAVYMITSKVRGKKN